MSEIKSTLEVNRENWIPSEDIFGVMVMVPDTKGMNEPVTCNYCGKCYDLRKASVVHQFADCSVFTTPCCGQVASDNLLAGYPAYKKIEKKN